jgi:hypothetical protein
MLWLTHNDGEETSYKQMSGAVHLGSTSSFFFEETTVCTPPVIG